ncbi:MAG TPA: hypothetical protein VJ761_11335 [Ktedonobacteraceae bacterium]|nr:hypothetical protein [Ktedonobacteraceae bacterium]
MGTATVRVKEMGTAMEMGTATVRVKEMGMAMEMGMATGMARVKVTERVSL